MATAFKQVAVETFNELIPYIHKWIKTNEERLNATASLPVEDTLILANPYNEFLLLPRDLVTASYRWSVTEAAPSQINLAVEKFPTLPPRFAPRSSTP